MLQRDIPVYRDPDSFETEGLEIKYPCSTNLMIYKALMHRYYITAEGFQQYGVDLKTICQVLPIKIQFRKKLRTIFTEYGKDCTTTISITAICRPSISRILG